ncbi:MAG: DUF255 domain-containing protein [Saprospiraceae bacterium]|nr:DUF255 domain-containing protein [Saprospiraceae bacterium]
MKKIVHIILICFLLPHLMEAQSLSYHQFEQIDSLSLIEKRPVAVFIYTDWCRYCKNMEQKTFQNTEVINKLNKKFYFISLNAEEERLIIFRGHPFQYKPNGKSTGIHALAEALGAVDNKISYPTFCILNTDYEIIFQYDAYLNAKNMITILDQLSN